LLIQLERDRKLNTKPVKLDGRYFDGELDSKGREYKPKHFDYYQIIVEQTPGASQ
jgi:hypothetical protein